MEMKKIIFLGLFLVPFFGISQQVAQMPELKALYRGYDNVLEIKIPKNIGVYRIFAEGAMIRKRDQTSWLVKTKSEDFATIGVINSAGDTIGVKEYRCLPLPQPVFFLGTVAEGNLMSREECALTLGYPDDPSLICDFKVKSFRCKISDKPSNDIEVVGNILSAEVIKKIAKNLSGQTVTIVAEIENSKGELLSSRTCIFRFK